MRKAFLWPGSFVAFVAMLAMVGVHVRLQQDERAMTRVAFGQARPAGKQLPAGFVLPSADVDLKISSLVAADLDADGDLDIVAAGNAAGSIGIVVWVNDGDGRLTRKSPERANTLGIEPGAPSFEQQRTTVIASIQPDIPAVQSGCGSGWLTLPEARCRMSPTRGAVSATLSRLRSRSPPALS